MRLFLGTLMRSFAEMKRYYVNTISSFVSMAIIFILIVVGFKSFGPGAGETLQVTALGYFVWISMLASMTTLSWTIMNEISRGIIEQEFLSPYGPLLVFLSYQLSDLVFSLPFLFGIMVLTFTLSGMNLAVNPVFFPLYFLLLFQSMGMGLILAGITLRYKRTNALLQLSQFAVIGLLFLDVRNPIGSILIPISPAFLALKDVIARKDSGGVVQIALGTALWFSIGAVVFTLFERNVRRIGGLSSY